MRYNWQLTPRIAIPKHEGDTKYLVEFTPVAVNLCNFKNGYRTRAILKLLLETFLDQLEDPFTCPVKKVWSHLNC